MRGGTRCGDGGWYRDRTTYSDGIIAHGRNIESRRKRPPTKKDGPPYTTFAAENIQAPAPAPLQLPARAPPHDRRSRVQVRPDKTRGKGGGARRGDEGRVMDDEGATTSSRGELVGKLRYFDRGPSKQTESGACPQPGHDSPRLLRSARAHCSQQPQRVTAGPESVHCGVP